MRKQPFTFAEFKEIYSKVPRLCVDLVIQTPKGIILTFRTKNGWQNQWHLPGGTVFYQESVRDAVERIAQEELGVKVTIKRFLGYVEFFCEIKERGFGYAVSLVFLCQSKTTHFHLDDQVEKVGLFNKLPKKVIAEHKKFLKKEMLLS